MDNYFVREKINTMKTLRLSYLDNNLGFGARGAHRGGGALVLGELMGGTEPTLIMPKSGQLIYLLLFLHNSAQQTPLFEF